MELVNSFRFILFFKLSKHDCVYEGVYIHVYIQKMSKDLKKYSFLCLIIIWRQPKKKVGALLIIIFRSGANDKFQSQCFFYTNF